MKDVFSVFGFMTAVLYIGKLLTMLQVHLDDSRPSSSSFSPFGVLGFLFMASTTFLYLFDSAVSSFFHRRIEKTVKQETREYYHHLIDLEKASSERTSREQYKNGYAEGFNDALSRYPSNQ